MVHSHYAPTSTISVGAKGTRPCYKCVPLTESGGDFDKILLQREDKWISNLCTLKYPGLNDVSNTFYKRFSFLRDLFWWTKFPSLLLYPFFCLPFLSPLFFFPPSVSLSLFFLCLYFFFLVFGVPPSPDKCHFLTQYCLYCISFA